MMLKPLSNELVDMRLMLQGMATITLGTADLDQIIAQPQPLLQLLTDGRWRCPSRRLQPLPILAQQMGVSHIRFGAL